MVFKKKTSYKYYLIFIAGTRNKSFKKGFISGIHFNLVTVDQKEKDITGKYFLQFLNSVFGEGAIAGLFLN